MIHVPYHVADSRIPGAGKGIVLDAAVAAGTVVVSPDQIPRTFSWDQLLAHPEGEAAMAASVRWFEEQFTVTTEWPDECYINHSFEATGLWHLGFVFAPRDLAAGEELTVDYRHLLRAGEYEVFKDAATGQPIVGYTWKQSLLASTRALLALAEQLPDA
jgi:hypothetical protein